MSDSTKPTTGKSTDSTTEDTNSSSSASYYLTFSELSKTNPTDESRAAQRVLPAESVAQGLGGGIGTKKGMETGTETIERSEGPDFTAPLETVPSKQSLAYRKTSQ